MPLVVGAALLASAIDLGVSALVVWVTLRRLRRPTRGFQPVQVPLRPDPPPCPFCGGPTLSPEGGCVDCSDALRALVRRERGLSSER